MSGEFTGSWGVCGPNGFSLVDLLELAEVVVLLKAIRAVHQARRTHQMCHPTYPPGFQLRLHL